MASQWFYRMEGRQYGPVEFRDLAVQLASGRLTAESLVRRDGTSEWVRAENVVGLLRAGRQAMLLDNPLPQRAVRDASPAAGEGAREKVTDGGEIAGAWQRSSGDARPAHRPFPPSTLVIVAGAGSIVLFALFWHLMAARRYPPPRIQTPLPGAAAQFANARPPSPQNPSVLALARGTPKLVVDLGSTGDARAPTLTPNLTLMVFAGKPAGQQHYDLYLAEGNPDRGFGPARRIDECNTRENDDGFPSLSPDGTRLLFVRSNRQERSLWLSRRSAEGKFTAPSRIDVRHLVREGDLLQNPQFLGPDSVALTGWDRSARPPVRLLTICRWDDQNETLSSPVRPEVTDRLAAYFVGTGGERMYFGFEQGLFAVGRLDNGSYGAAQQLAGVELTGPVQGPVWVTPAEDVIFYSSPGAGGETASPSQIWALRY